MVISFAGKGLKGRNTIAMGIAHSCRVCLISNYSFVYCKKVVWSVVFRGDNRNNKDRPCGLSYFVSPLQGFYSVLRGKRFGGSKFNTMSKTDNRNTIL